MRRLIRRKYDLLACVVKVVKGMEKFLQTTPLASQKLDIVQQKHIHTAVLLTEIINGILAHQYADQCIGELFTGHIHDIGGRIGLQNRVANGMHQMRFAKAGAPMDKQRIVFLAGRNGSPHSRRMRKLVARTHHKGIKGISWI